MSNQTTVVGASTRISGNLQGDQDLQVSGRIDGSIELTSTLYVEPSGVVVADVHVARAMIRGTVMGNVTASELIHIAADGKVVGDIAAPRVVMVEGAAFRGEVDMGDFDSPRPHAAEQPAAAQRPPRPARPPRRVGRAETGEPSLERKASEAAKAVARAVKRDVPPTLAGSKAAAKVKAKTTAKAAPKVASKPKAKAKAPARKAGKRRPPTTAGKKTRVRRK